MKFLDPFSAASPPSELLLSGMQLIDLAEERARDTGKGGGGELLRYIHSVHSLTEAVLRLRD